MVALDGFRIAWRYEELNQAESTDDDYFKIIVPGNTLLEISRIFQMIMKRISNYMQVKIEWNS